MTLTIGRVSLIDDPSDISYAGDRLVLAGWFFGSSLAHAKVLRQQMLGLADNEDEPDVPVIWSADADIDGYYTVGSVNVTPVLGVSYERFGFQYAVQLERVQGGFAAPLCEVAAALALRTNGVGVTTSANGAVWVPSTASFRAARYIDGQIAVMGSNAASLRVSETGPVAGAFSDPGVTPGFLSVTSATLPADYYDGSALIEQSVGGVWYPVVGDQIGSVVGNMLRIGNGLVRATFHTDGVITSEIFDGTVWESSTSFSLLNSGAAAGTWFAEGGWKILRNDPAVCVVRTSAQFDTGGNNFPASVSIYIERGKMLFELFVDNMFYDLAIGTYTNETLQLRANTVTASTALTGGIRQTSNNAQGHRWIMMCPTVVTNDLTNGRITIAVQSAPLIAQFGLGWERDGSASAGKYQVTDVSTEYFGTAGLRQRVVAR